MHGVILEGDVLDKGMETMRFDIVISNDFPKIVWGLGRKCSYIGTRSSSLTLIAKMVIWYKGRSKTIYMAY